MYQDYFATLSLGRFLLEKIKEMLLDRNDGLTMEEMMEELTMEEMMEMMETMEFTILPPLTFRDNDITYETISLVSLDE